MLFAYRYVEHSIEKMQACVDFLFLEVWCKAEGDFDIDKLDACPELKEIVLEIYYNDRIKDYLYGPIERIFNAFKLMEQRQKNIWAEWYKTNNAIEKLCRNTTTDMPVNYRKIGKSYPLISEELKQFFTNLYTNVLGLSAVEKRVGSMEDHYKAFITANEDELCPFCGLSDLTGPYTSRREAYDHYLPKETYPFNSVNFRNLAPMCHQCNSSNKFRQDPLFRPPGERGHRAPASLRRKAFYPYTRDKIDIKIKVALLSNDISNLTPEQIDLEISSVEHPEEVRTWTEVFNIEERYKDIMRKKNYGKYWYIQVADECRNENKSPTDLYQSVKISAQKNPWAEKNFLRVPFLKACEKIGLFNITD